MENLSPDVNPLFMTLLYNNIIIIAVYCRFIEDKILNVQNTI